MFDRFSNLPPPSAAPVGSRSYSPAPRRPSPLASSSARGYNPRSSSLSLISRGNSSSDSLSRASRAANVPIIRTEVHAAGFVEDPLEALARIVGSRVPINKNTENGLPVEKPAQLSEEIDFRGLSLDDYAAQPIRSSQSVNSHIQSAESVEEYEKESSRFEDLHRSILACDGVLKSVETSLAGFQKDLGVVSTEIETLQCRSTALNTKLENRKVVEQLLGPAVEDISISPFVVKTISEGHINDIWIRSLAELQKRMKAIASKTNGTEGVTNIKAITDVRPLLDNLNLKAAERIRDYLVTQIKSFRSPNINAQIIQQQHLVKYKDLYIFLTKSQPQLALEIGQAYVNTIRWYYHTHFGRYRQALEKLSLVQVDKNDGLGVDPSAPRTKTPGTPTARDAHNLGRRADVLKASNTSAISSYLAEEDKSSQYIESIFRTFNLALVDNVSAEYSFLTSFFTTDTFVQMSRRCADIFAPTFALGQSLTTELISTSYDCLGILMCVRLNQRFAFELQRRKVPVADSYVNSLNMLLWPRFQVAMDLHTESIKALSSTISSRSAASKLSFTGTSSDASKLSTAPHYLTQRFSQLLYGILAVSSEAGDDEPLSNSLGRLRAEYEAFLAKASKSAGADAKKRERFLANNYALVLTIIADAEGRLAEEQKAHFEEVNKTLGK